MTDPGRWDAGPWKPPGTEQCCGEHPTVMAAIVCADCRNGMCRACYDAAPWPWKVCAACSAKRSAASPVSDATIGAA